MRMMRVRQLQGDVNEREEAELRRLEGGLQVGGEPATAPAEPEGAAAVVPSKKKIEVLCVPGVSTLVTPG